MLNIAVLTWLDPWSKCLGRSGGAEKQMQETFSRIAEKGHKLTFVVSNCGQENLDLIPKNIRVIRAGNWYTANFAINRKLRQFAKKEKFDIVIENLSKLPFFSPKVVKCPVVCIVPHLFRKHIYRVVNPLSGMYVNFMEGLIPRVYRDCKFIAVSASTKVDLIDLGIAQEMIEVVHNGLDHEVYNLDGDIKNIEPTIIHVGRLMRYKSVDHIIKSMPFLRQNIPNVRLEIIGDGPDKQRLEKIVIKMGLNDCVFIHGFLSVGEKLKYLQKAHVFVNTSSKEGWGLNIIEANACGLPVVAYDSYGLRDSVTKENGILVCFGEIDSLSHAIGKLLQDSKQLAFLSQSAVCYSKNFTWDKCASEVLSIIKKNLG